MSGVNLKDLAKSQEVENKIKLRDLVNSQNAINLLVIQKLPVFTAFKLSLFLKYATPIVSSYNEQKDKICGEACVRDDKGNPALININGLLQYKFPNEVIEKEVKDKLDKLLDVDVDIKTPDIKIGDLEGVKIEPMYLNSLIWMIKE
jgi:hypothetical protein